MSDAKRRMNWKVMRKQQQKATEQREAAKSPFPPPVPTPVPVPTPDDKIIWPAHAFGPGDSLRFLTDIIPIDIGKFSWENEEADVQADMRRMRHQMMMEYQYSPMWTTSPQCRDHQHTTCNFTLFGPMCACKCHKPHDQRTMSQWCKDDQHTACYWPSCECNCHIGGKLPPPKEHHTCMWCATELPTLEELEIHERDCDQ